MKPICGALLLVAGLSSVAQAASEQSALLSVYGPAVRRAGPDSHIQTIWLSVPASTPDSVYLRLFDADCAGRWDIRVGGWNTATSYALYPAPASLARDSLLLEEPIAREPLASLSLAADPVFDEKWGTLTAFVPRQGHVSGEDALFVLQIVATEGDDGNRFDVALSSSRKSNDAVPGARMWCYQPVFRLSTPAGQSAEVRFFVPPGTESIQIKTGNAGSVQLGLHSWQRSGMTVSAAATGVVATTTRTVRSSEAGRDWAIAARWLVRGWGDVYVGVSDQGDHPVPIWLPVGVGRSNTRPRPAISAAHLSDCRTVLFDASGSSDGDGDLLTYGWDFGDGTKGDGLRVTHRYEAPGKFVGTLTVQDPSGRINDVASTTYDVTINDVTASGRAAGSAITDVDNTQFRLLYRYSEYWIDASRIPEPATLSLLAVGAVMAMCRRKRA